MYYADPVRDLPSPFKAKRIIFYAAGLKVYGQIPYILQRRLQAEFFSNNAPFMGGRLVAPSRERNYTVIPYRRHDGKQHLDAVISALMDWLYADRGFEFAIAAEFYANLKGPNWWREMPETIIPATNEHQQIVLKLLAQGGIDESGA